MKKTKKALASLAIAGMTLSMIPFNVFAASPVPTRLAGVTAEQTAVKIADQTGYTGTAILASSTSYGMVDALTAGPLAASLKAPILLTGAGSSLDAATKAELTKLAVKKVYVTSGTAVIKQSVIDELKGMGIEVEALGGYDRAETSVNIAKKMTGVTKVAVANTVVDALSIAAVASAANEPILLTDRDALPASVAAYLASAGVTASDVIGGTGVISNAVVAGLPGATRHAGMSAYDTNNQVIQDFAGSLAFDNVYVANGVTGIDALAGAPLAAQTKSPIVLTDGKTVPAAAAFTHSKKADAVVTALGGEFVVPESVRVGVAAGAVTPDSNELNIVSVSALDDTNRYLKMEFSKAVSGLEASNISIVDSKTGDAYGVKAVSVSANGLTAQLELFAGDDGYVILKDATAYTITVSVNGTVLTTTFVRSAHLDEDDDARVTKVDSDKRQFTVSYVDSNDNAKTITLDVPTNSSFNFQEALGQVIRVWYDGDEKLIKYEYDTPKVVYEAIEFDKVDRVKTLNEEVKYDIAKDAVVIINDGATGEVVADSAAEIAALLNDTYDFAKLIFNDDGDVERIYAYDFTDDPILVDSVDDTLIQGQDSNELDLDDYVVVDGSGKQIAIKDIKKGDLVFFNDDAYGGDGIAFVINKTVSGEITDVYEDSLDIAGKNYDYNNANGDVQYLNEDGEFDDLDDTAAEQLQAGGNVTAYFNLRNQLVYVIGSVEDVSSNSDSLYLQDKMLAYLDSKGDFQLDFDGINSQGEDESYDFAIDDLDKISVQTATDEIKFEVDDSFPGNDTQEIDKFAYASAYNGTSYTPAVSSATAQYIVAVNADGDHVELVVDLTTIATTTAPHPAGDATEQTNNVIKVGKDDNGAVNKLTFINSFAALTDSIDEDDDYANGHELLDSTVVYDVSRADKFYDPDTDDVEVTTWGELKKSGVDIQAGQALVYFNDDDEVTQMVTYNDSVADDQEFTALITSVAKSDGDIVRISALVNGEKKTYEVKDSNAASVREGSVAVIKVNEAGTIVTDLAFASTTNRFVTGEVTAINVSEGKITLNGEVYKLGSDAEVYDATDADGDDYTVEGGLRDVDLGDSVVLGLSATGSKFVDVVALVNSADYAPTVVDASFVNGTTFTVTFSEKVTAATAQAIGNYAVSDGATVTAAVLDADGFTVTVTTTTAPITAANTVTVTNVKDLAGKTMAPSAATSL